MADLVTRGKLKFPPPPPNKKIFHLAHTEAVQHRMLIAHALQVNVATDTV